MENKFLLLGRLLNFLTLLVGLVIGFYAGIGYSGRVHAQAQDVVTAQKNVEEVSPNITAGSAAFGTLLSGRLATDELSVKGFDPVKFDENILNLLATKVLFTRAELERVVDQSKSDKILRMKQPEVPKPSSEKKP